MRTLRGRRRLGLGVGVELSRRILGGGGGGVQREEVVLVRRRLVPWETARSSSEIPMSSAMYSPKDRRMKQRNHGVVWTSTSVQACVICVPWMPIILARHSPRLAMAAPARRSGQFELSPTAAAVAGRERTRAALP